MRAARAGPWFPAVGRNDEQVAQGMVNPVDASNKLQSVQRQHGAGIRWSDAAAEEQRQIVSARCCRVCPRSSAPCQSGWSRRPSTTIGPVVRTAFNVRAFPFIGVRCDRRCGAQEHRQDCERSRAAAVDVGGLSRASDVRDLDVVPAPRAALHSVSGCQTSFRSARHVSSKDGDSGAHEDPQMIVR